MIKTNVLKVLGALSIVAIIATSVASCKCDKKPVDNATNTITAAVGAVVGNIAGTYDSIKKNWIYDIGTLKDLTLPNGNKLNVGENSSEAILFNRLNDENYKVSDSITASDWISLDRVYYETGKDVLTLDSENQVKNIAEILKAFPNTVLKIGGYTDNTGTADINKTLSEQRAKTVVAKLISLGIGADRVSGEGYGPEFPVCPANDTPECQAQNRRVDIRIKSK